MDILIIMNNLFKKDDRYNVIYARVSTYKKNLTYKHKLIKYKLSALIIIYKLILFSQKFLVD